MWFKIKNQQIEIRIFAKPNAKKSALLKIDNEAVHIALHAKPKEGEANKALVSFLAKLFGLPKSQVILQKGETSRYKVIVMPLTDVTQQFLDYPDRFTNRPI